MWIIAILQNLEQSLGQDNGYITKESVGHVTAAPQDVCNAQDF